MYYIPFHSDDEGVWAEEVFLFSLSNLCRLSLFNFFFGNKGH